MHDNYDHYNLEDDTDNQSERQLGDSTFGAPFGPPSGQQPGAPPMGHPFGQPSGQQPGGPPIGPSFGQPGGAPFGQQPGAPPMGPPFGQPGGPPSGRPPAGRPPAFVPHQAQGIAPQFVNPGAIRPCRFRFVYIWLTTGQQFWAWLVFVGPNSVSGWRWTGFRWVYFGIDLRYIASFQCY